MCHASASPGAAPCPLAKLPPMCRFAREEKDVSSSKVAGGPSQGLGVLWAVGAFAIWGILPLYFNLLHEIPPVQIVAYRILFSLAFLAVVTSLTRRWSAVRSALSDWRTVRILTLTAVLIAANWLTYVYAVLNGHVLEASLGYFINPLVNVTLGLAVLGERLRPIQAGAIALAAGGVLVLAVSGGGSLWVPISLALTFSIYGLIRKMAPVDGMSGLTVETMVLAPVAFGFVLLVNAQGNGAIGVDRQLDLFIVLSGVVTAIPLLLFNVAAKRMRYSTIGIIQYLAPSLQFLEATLLFGEAFELRHLLTFGLIWTGCLLYVADMVRGARQAVAVSHAGAE
jgi:chloramphenicol-sensitive protein RarD